MRKAEIEPSPSVATIRSAVRSEVEFAELVRQGRESAKLGPCRDFSIIDAAIRRSLQEG